QFDVRRQEDSLLGALAEFIVATGNLPGHGDPRQLLVARTTGALFDVLAAAPALGRTLTVDDERKNAADVVVITDALWRERLGASLDAVGRPLTIDGKAFPSVGGLPLDFRLAQSTMVMSQAMNLTTKTDAYVPLKLDLDDVGWVGDFNYTVVGRLKRGVAVEQARAELNVLQARAAVIAAEREHEPAVLTA